MRSQPQSFQGLRDQGVQIIADLKTLYSFQYVCEVSDPRQVEQLASIVDIFQVGARSMYNYELLKELARYKRPVLLKRAFSATIDEWLGAAGYLDQLGTENILLCERGIRGFDDKLRNLLDLASVIWLKQHCDYKVYVDPSHAMGHSRYIPMAAQAAIAAGADGLLLEVHPEPDKALCDGQQALNLKQFDDLIRSLETIAGACQISLQY